MKLTRVALAARRAIRVKELLRLLAGHRHFRLEAKIGREDDLAALKGRVDLAFLCTPAETSLKMAAELLALGIHVVDVSGAFRLKAHGYPDGMASSIRTAIGCGVPNMDFIPGKNSPR